MAKKRTKLDTAIATFEAQLTALDTEYAGRRAGILAGIATLRAQQSAESKPKRRRTTATTATLVADVANR